MSSTVEKVSSRSEIQLRKYVNFYFHRRKSVFTNPNTAYTLLLYQMKRIFIDFFYLIAYNINFVDWSVHTHGQLTFLYNNFIFVNEISNKL
jgi:hypothetical protein